MGLPSWARVGAKVVCRDDAPEPGSIWLKGEAPVVGGIYTVAGVIQSGPNGRPCFHLVELRRAPRSILVWGADVGYYVHRFRPLVTIGDDLEAHFAHHLTTSSPQGVDA